MIIIYGNMILYVLVRASLSQSHIIDNWGELNMSETHVILYRDDCVCMYV